MKTNKLFMACLLALGLAFASCSSPGGGDNGPAVVPNGTPVASDFNISGTRSVIFDGGFKELTVTAKAEKTAGDITVYYQGTSYPKDAQPPTQIGTYTVTFDVEAADGWDAATGLSAGSLAITDGLPAVPANVSVTVASATSLKLSWSTVSNAASYKVYYITEGLDDLALAGTALGTASYTHTGLTADQVYYYYVVAENNYGQSDYSPFKPAKISIPDVPASVEATATSSSTITVRWSSVTGATSYKIFYTANFEANTKVEITGTTLTGTSTSLNSAAAGTTYYFFIKAVNALGESDFSPAGSAKTFAPPNDKLGVDARIDSPFSWIKVTATKWTMSQYEDLFILYTTDSPDNPKRYFCSFSLTELNYELTRYENLYDPLPNTTYYFWATRASYMAPVPDGQMNNYFYSLIDPYGNNPTGTEKFESPDGYSPVAIVRTGPPPPPPTPPSSPLPTVPPSGGGSGEKLCPNLGSTCLSGSCKPCINGYVNCSAFSIAFPCDSSCKRCLGTQKAKCGKCNGTGKCQRCGGTGKI